MDSAAAAPMVINHDRAAPPRSATPPINPKVKRVIYLHMIGAPSQLGLFDYQAILKKYDGKDCPQSDLKGEHFALLTKLSAQSIFLCLDSSLSSNMI
jgi:hypothetical protein|tara:strand:+ start:1685 stop:1975 length:291 start_codon:yes stop_codon:yes gene_type:complete